MFLLYPASSRREGMRIEQTILSANVFDFGVDFIWTQL
jgi:hypothetical protein